MTTPIATRHAATRCVITGGTQGLGLAIAKRLAREGAAGLVISGRRAALGEAAAAEVSALGTPCQFVAADVARPEDCARLMATAIERLGAVNALVNSAATTDRGSLLDTTLEMWQAQMDTNARGPFLLMQALVRHLLERKAPGAIVNILSQSAHCGQSFLVPYSASKATLANLTKNVAQSFRRHRIRCNGVMAGWMDTPGEAAIQKKAHDAPDDWLQRAEAGRPMGQLAKPDELAGLVSYMLSPESGVMTGALVDYDQWVPGAQPE
ncbi:MAG TPA: SDR family oxidoreductase [Burkholderiaceae bacterium]|nr:SDR family oxidoreductase [Burkholderiaceae bacterium]